MNFAKATELGVGLGIGSMLLIVIVGLGDEIGLILNTNHLGRSTLQKIPNTMHNLDGKRTSNRVESEARRSI